METAAFVQLWSDSNSEVVLPTQHERKRSECRTYIQAGITLDWHEKEEGRVTDLLHSVILNTQTETACDFRLWHQSFISFKPYADLISFHWFLALTYSKNDAFWNWVGTWLCGNSVARPWFPYNVVQLEMWPFIQNSEIWKIPKQHFEKLKNVFYTETKDTYARNIFKWMWLQGNYVSLLPRWKHFRTTMLYHDVTCYLLRCICSHPVCSLLLCSPGRLSLSLVHPLGLTGAPP